MLTLCQQYKASLILEINYITKCKVVVQLPTVELPVVHSATAMWSSAVVQPPQVESLPVLLARPLLHSSQQLFSPQLSYSPQQLYHVQTPAVVPSQAAVQSSAVVIMA
jgi:hypothetical protein